MARIQDTTLGELLEQLQDLANDHGPHTPVRILSNDFNPWELEVKQATAINEECPFCDGNFSPCEVCDGEGKITRIYLITGDQIRYMPDELKSQIS